MAAQARKDIFLSSLERCAAREGFIPTFYERFRGSSREIRARFLTTDFTKQHGMLLRSLRLAAGAVTGEAASLAELWARTETHDRHHLNIPAWMYKEWLDAALATAAEFDPDWSPVVEDAWQMVLGHVAAHMMRHY